MAVTQLYSSDFYMNIHQSPGQDIMLFRIFSYSKRKRPYYQKFHIPEQQPVILSGCCFIMFR